MPPKNKNKKFLAKQKAMQEEKKRKEEEEEEARKMAEKLSLSNGNGHDAATNGSRGKRPTAEELGFFIRTGPDAEHRTSLNMDIIVEGFTLTAGSLELISSGLLALNFGVKYGLVGRNGVGKSTLLRAISRKQLQLPDFLHIVHVEQEIAGDDRTALQAVLEADLEREWLLKTEEKILNQDADQEEEGPITLNEIYDRLLELDSDSAESRAANILDGLGFDYSMQHKATREFSGGWRMRIALAQALFLQPDLLLLDEPTNHLDVNALTWLEEFLNAWKKTVIIVSHDRGFLNAVTTNIVFLHHKKLKYYGGNYDTFVKVRSEHRANQMATKKEQERREAHLKQFIARFGQGHKKMAKQAQSRQKMLSKLQDQAVEVDYDDPYLRLDFPAATRLPPPCISVNNVSFGYTEDQPLFEELNFGVDMDSRVAIVGPNGAGKSTFLKLLDGDLIPIDGWVNRHCKLRLARFTQYHLEMMDVEVDSVTHMRRLDGEISIEEARKYLGRFGLGGDLSLKSIKLLSGGQKSRLAFAVLAWKRPHILLMDEPTNHLDLETIEALAMALNKFEGGVVLVSHDERLISLVCDELWVVHRGKKGRPGTVEVFDGTFDEYREKLRFEFQQKQQQSATQISAKLG